MDKEEPTDARAAFAALHALTAGLAPDVRAELMLALRDVLRRAYASDGRALPPWLRDEEGGRD